MLQPADTQSTVQTKRTAKADERMDIGLCAVGEPNDMAAKHNRFRFRDAGLSTVYFKARTAVHANTPQFLAPALRQIRRQGCFKTAVAGGAGRAAEAQTERNEPHGYQPNTSIRPKR